jgi:hypothetical protein
MAKWIVIDEIHLTVRIPANQPKSSTIIRTLKNKRFQTQLQAAINGVFRLRANLRPVKIALSR